MDAAKLFMTGRSQAVRLPKIYRFAGKEVIVKRLGNENGALLLSADDPWRLLEASLSGFEPGFQIERSPPETQHRPDIVS